MSETKSARIQSGYRYGAPSDMMLQHAAICLAIIIVVGFLMTKFLSFVTGGPISAQDQDTGYLAGILSMSLFFFGNMPCRLIIYGNGGVKACQLEAIFDRYLSSDRYGGFRFGYKTKKINENFFLYIPEYNPAIPEKFRLGANGDGLIFNIFSAQSCISVKYYDTKTIVVAPYRSMKNLSSHLKKLRHEQQFHYE